MPGFGTVVHYDGKKRFGFIKPDDPSLTNGEDIFFHMDKHGIALSRPGRYPEITSDRGNRLEPNFDPRRNLLRVVYELSWEENPRGLRVLKWCYRQSWDHAVESMRRNLMQRIPNNISEARDWEWRFVRVYGTHRDGDHHLFPGYRVADLGFDASGEELPAGQYALWVLPIWTVPYGRDRESTEAVDFMRQTMSFLWGDLQDGDLRLQPPLGWTRHRSIGVHESHFGSDDVVYFIEPTGLAKLIISNPSYSTPRVIVPRFPQIHICNTNCEDMVQWPSGEAVI